MYEHHRLFELQHYERSNGMVWQQYDPVTAWSGNSLVWQRHCLATVWSGNSMVWHGSDSEDQLASSPMPERSNRPER